MTEKRVDESWKNSVEKERGREPQEPVETPLPDTSLPFFVSTLGMQALLSLGEIPDPVTNQKKTSLTPADFAHAQYLIDVISMLQEKTKGNLTDEEEAMLKGLLYELKMKFVEKTQKTTAPS